MTDLPSLTEDDIRHLATSRSFERGEAYYASGAVFDAERRDNTLVAHVQGSQYQPYRVTVTLGASGIETAACTCPYDWGGICKHVVATLLTWVHEPEDFHVLAPLDELLAERSKEDLIALVKEMIVREPDLARLLELPLSPDSSVPFDLAAFRKQAGYALSRDDVEWAARELERLRETADRYLEANNPTAAGALYHLILDETLSRFEDWWVARIIREAIAYAGELGFKPDPDYRDAMLVLGDADPDARDVPIPLGGRNGRPFFIAGLYDNVDRIMAKLTRKLGPDGFTFFVPISEDTEVFLLDE